MTYRAKWSDSRGALLVFDGDCAFCTSAVNRLKAVLTVFPQYEPWQWLDYESLGLSLHEVTHYAWVLTPTRKYGGHLAFAALMRLQPPFGWRLLGNLIATPHELAAQRNHAVAEQQRVVAERDQAMAEQQRVVAERDARIAALEAELRRRGGA